MLPSYIAVPLVAGLCFVAAALPPLVQVWRADGAIAVVAAFGVAAGLAAALYRSRSHALLLAVSIAAFVGAPWLGPLVEHWFIWSPAASRLAVVVGLLSALILGNALARALAPPPHPGGEPQSGKPT